MRYELKEMNGRRWVWTPMKRVEGRRQWSRYGNKSRRGAGERREAIRRKQSW